MKLYQVRLYHYDDTYRLTDQAVFTNAKQAVAEFNRIKAQIIKYFGEYCEEDSFVEYDNGTYSVRLVVIQTEGSIRYFDKDARWFESLDDENEWHTSDHIRESITDEVEDINRRTVRGKLKKLYDHINRLYKNTVKYEDGTMTYRIKSYEGNIVPVTAFIDSFSDDLVVEFS